LISHISGLLTDLAPVHIFTFFLAFLNLLGFTDVLDYRLADLGRDIKTHLPGDILADFSWNSLGFLSTHLFRFLVAGDSGYFGALLPWHLAAHVLGHLDVYGATHLRRNSLAHLIDDFVADILGDNLALGLRHLDGNVLAFGGRHQVANILCGGGGHFPLQDTRHLLALFLHNVTA